MNIAMAVRQFRAVGGAEKVTRRMAEHLVVSGHTVNVIAYKADALILPSHYDPFANVTIEAMGAGLPVITTRQNGGGELVDAETGWVVESAWDESAMAGAITALANSSRRLAMGAAAREIAKRHLLADKMKEIEEVLFTVAEEKKKAGRHHG